MTHNLGYCCINQTLRKQGVYTGRGLIRRTFSIESASEKALANCTDLLSILKWNKEHNIRVFRIGSEIFPRMTDKIVGYNFHDLLSHKECGIALALAGKFAKDNDMILSCHPGPYTVLGSEREDVVTNSILEVEMHALIADLLRRDAPDLQFHINFHIGNKFSLESGDRFCLNFERLSKKAQDMVIVENDDKAACWSINKLHQNIHQKIGVPLTFDFHHSKFSREADISAEEEFKIAQSTWSDKPSMQEVHYSSSESNTPKHSDYVLEKIPEWMLNDPKVYIHLEVKQKELALLKYLKENSENS